MHFRRVRVVTKSAFYLLNVLSVRLSACFSATPAPPIGRISVKFVIADVF